MDNCNALQLAWRRGRWSFVVTPPLSIVPLADLLTTRMEPWEARPWTVTLARWQYSGGPLPRGNAFPPENQLDTSPRYRARVTWGVDGASELALVDYPPRGVTFQVSAANIQVAIDSEVVPTEAVPTLSGFLAPGTRNRDGDGAPTFTTAEQAVGTGAAQATPIPSRAFGYRFVLVATPALAPATPICELRQLDQDLVLEAHDAIVTASNAVAVTEDLQGQRRGWFPLMPTAQLVQVNNITTVTINYRLQFLLDMG